MGEGFEKDILSSFFNPFFGNKIITNVAVNIYNAACYFIKIIFIPEKKRFNLRAQLQ